MKPLASFCLVMLLAWVSGCGERSSEPTSAGGEWRTERLGGDVAVDTAPVVVASGDDLLVVMITEDGELLSHLSTDGAPFEAGTPKPVQQALELGGAVRMPNGHWYLLASSFSDYRPAGFRSSDGLAWEPVSVEGFADAADIGGLAVADETLIAVGTYRTERDPDMGGFQAQVWTSSDGVAFTESDLPAIPEYRTYDDESVASGVAITSGDVLVGGRASGDARLWRSSDAGATWSTIDADALAGSYSVTDVRAQGGTVVASIVGGETQAARSADGGRTWTVVPGLSVDPESEAWAPLWTGAGHFFTLTGVDDMSWSDPGACYADLDQCGQQSEPQLVASRDGGDWTIVDTSGLGEIGDVVGTDDGRVLVLTGEGDGLAVHTWPAGAALPVGEEPAVPPTADVTFLPDGDPAEPGVRYAAPMYIHCGMDWFWFGGTAWHRTDGGEGVETGAGETPPPGWPARGQMIYGFATIDDDAGVLTYETEDGTVMATYEEKAGAPGCA